MSPDLLADEAKYCSFGDTVHYELLCRTHYRNAQLA